MLLIFAYWRNPALNLDLAGKTGNIRFHRLFKKVSILRPNGGHVDGFACFGVQTSSSEPPNNLTGIFLSHFKRNK